MGKLPSFREWRKRHTEQPVSDGMRSQEKKVERVVEAFDTFQKINEATEDELLSIKGIGPKSVQKILSARPISDLETLKEAKLSHVALSALQSHFSV